VEHGDPDQSVPWRAGTLDSGPTHRLMRPPVGETRVDLLHLLENRLAVAAARRLIRELGTIAAAMFRD